MRRFCTYFDRNYLSRGLALHSSLRQHAVEFELVVLCMDEGIETELQARQLPGVRLLSVSALLNAHPLLAAAQHDRSRIEFYFTCTPWLMRHLLPTLPAGELLTYLDADMYFFASPEPVFAEIGAASVAITPHRFPASLGHLERYGRYNVGWVSLRHDDIGTACAADWADKCAAWCFNRLEADRYADQKYLDAWSSHFPGTISLENPGVNAAPWNARDALVEAGPTINGHRLIFYHFHALHHLGRGLYDHGLHKYDAAMSEGMRSLVYRPYLDQLHPGDASVELPDVIPPSRPDDPRAGLAVVMLLERLRASELDRAQRLTNLETIAADRDLARADLERNVTVLRAVQKDNDDRLASIVFYQDKLKTAYEDLERNVAYLKTLEAEIQAHIKVGSDKDAIIQDLHERLRRATAADT